MLNHLLYAVFIERAVMTANQLFMPGDGTGFLLSGMDSAVRLTVGLVPIVADDISTGGSTAGVCWRNSWFVQATTKMGKSIK